MRLLLIALVCLLSFKSEAQYHIKVECYGEPMAVTDWKQWYAIRFTNDNWKSSETILYTYTSDCWNVYGTDLFRSKEEALYKARQFKSYWLCVDYNRKVNAKQNRDKPIADALYRKMKNDERLEELNKKKQAAKESNCCKEIKVY